MVPDAADGKELRPPSLGQRATLPDRRNMLATPIRGHCRCLVNISYSRTAREPSRVRYGRNRSRDRRLPDPNFPTVGWGDASQPSWMRCSEDVRHGCTRVGWVTGQGDHSARVPARRARGRLRKGRPLHEVGGLSRVKLYRIEPARQAVDRARIILATPAARPASCGFRRGGESPDRHGGAWRTSRPHCASSRSCPWPDRI